MDPELNDLLAKAVQIAATAHLDQKEKAGLPYITHPLRVMANVQAHGVAAQIVAVLHDVVEDTSTTMDDLRREGFNEDLLGALELVTHREGVSYADYVVKCKPNAVARQVKIGDLMDNGRLDRSLLRRDRLDSDIKRIHRYFLSYHFLTDKMSEADYRAAMATYG